ncbi:MAG TPA: hypothetical protein VJ302_10355 [Blastocatellia bacterium]|nr:hypothetical protein [Blastocatellia bacterium]
MSSFHGSPILVLNDVTCGLLREIWRAEHELWPSSQMVNERQVRRRTAGTVDTVRQPGLVVRGDGTGYALRGAILAASVINGAASGLPVSEGLRHYTLRLRKAFHSHLKECLGYYSEEFTSPGWQSEIERMARAHSEEESNFGTADQFRYVLNGLQPVPG